MMITIISFLKNNNRVILNILCVILFTSLITLNSGAQDINDKVDGDKSRIHIEWRGDVQSGKIKVLNGSLKSIEVEQGNGKAKDNMFIFSSSGRGRVLLQFSGVNIKPGPEATIVSVVLKKNSFSFFLRDVTKGYPIYLPDYGVVVLAEDDQRSFQEVELEILKRKTLTKIQKIEREKETSFELAARETRNMTVPVWLGVSRDMRIFEIEEELEDTRLQGKVIRPRYSSTSVNIPENKYNAYIYALGRGVGPRKSITRRLDRGFLPIYHSELKDDDILYRSTSFVSFAKEDRKSVV